MCYLLLKVKPRVVKPNHDEKSSFLTQLLRKPLDKEGTDVSSTSIGSTPVHPVYFPAFTPIVSHFMSF